MNLIEWFADPAHWAGPDGIPRQVLTHLVYCAIAAAVAIVVALPAGLVIGHTGRGAVVVAGLANALRALPTLGLLIAAVLLVSPHVGSQLAFTVPALIVLVVLAIPPILTNAYAGVTAVPPQVRTAAHGIGMRPWQVLLTVELPCALPLVISGVRSASLQLVSTATVAAYVSLGGLGRYIIDGQAQLDYTQMLAGAILVALLAIVVEALLLLLERLVVSPGLTGRLRRLPDPDRAPGAGPDPAPTAAPVAAPASGRAP
ncbi:ABC transporter permease [Nocardiopsis flavescens]|uniref:Osmoprotectant transport system permease protein n=1 Tax=Nocardiopsis flavescens TaxID=758803 RepID=A0A1M6UB38_9ACTN|nr:ABC transporter permease [Nocardiopsis flavescens]SHK66278.1 osmoprotectant transport system permease protein [Nocardiopsis flavescens]